MSEEKKTEQNNEKPASPDLAVEVTALKAQIAELLAAQPKKEDPTLLDSVRKAKEKEENDQSKVKTLESALTFTMKSPEFYKQNAAILPKEVEGIFDAAEKEKYSNAIEKADSIKAGIIQSFFSVQANVDILTGSQKVQLEQYLSLTKNGKQEKASDFYDRIFEPAFETLKRVKKAESLQKGLGSGDDDAYKKRLMAGSNRHYLGENKNA
jgi:formiminotetrahydrofolate cyclodeaminase